MKIKFGQLPLSIQKVYLCRPLISSIDVYEPDSRMQYFKVTLAGGIEREWHKVEGKWTMWNPQGPTFHMVGDKWVQQGAVR